MYGRKLTVWQIAVLGLVWIGAGIALHLLVPLPGTSPELVENGVIDARRSAFAGIAIIGFLRNTHFLLLGPCAVGAWHLFVAGRALRHTAPAVEARPADMPAPPEVRRAPLDAPPRLGNDPFRGPPRPAPVAVIRNDKPLPAAPVVAGNPDDKPKILG